MPGIGKGAAIKGVAKGRNSPVTTVPEATVALKREQGRIINQVTGRLPTVLATVSPPTNPPVGPAQKPDPVRRVAQLRLARKLEEPRKGNLPRQMEKVSSPQQEQAAVRPGLRAAGAKTVHRSAVATPPAVAPRATVRRTLHRKAPEGRAIRPI